MYITIFERKPKKNDGNPNYIVWDMHEMKRLSVAETYTKALEIKKDWETIPEQMYDQLEIPFA